MQSRSPSKAWYVLLVLPYIAMLWVPSYNASEPSWLGFPFFYWYQLLWVVGSSVLVAIVYKMTKRGAE